MRIEDGTLDAAGGMEVDPGGTAAAVGAEGALPEVAEAAE
jgi:hypothetical protein